MSEHGRRGRTVRSFLFGGVVGGAIAVAAPRMRRRPPAGPERTVGLGAFEGAPCWHYDHGGSPGASEGHSTSARGGGGSRGRPASPVADHGGSPAVSEGHADGGVQRHADAGAA